MQHHFDRGADNDADPAGWSRASYSLHPVDMMEPLPDVVNGYRDAALYFLGIMLAADEYCATATDARLAVVAVAVVLGWPSTRGLTVPEIAGQLGVSVLTITRACARFREIAGLNSAGGGVRFIRPGVGSNGDKPAAARA